MRIKAWGWILILAFGAVVAVGPFSAWRPSAVRRDPDTGAIVVPIRGFRFGWVRGMHGVFLARLEHGEFRAFSPIDPHSSLKLGWYEPTLKMRLDLTSLWKGGDLIGWEGDPGNYFAVPGQGDGKYGIDGSCLQSPCAPQGLNQLEWEQAGNTIIIYPDRLRVGER